MRVLSPLIGAGLGVQAALGQPSEVDRLRQMIEQQQQQIEAQEKRLESMRRTLDALTERAVKQPGPDGEAPAAPEPVRTADEMPSPQEEPSPPERPAHVRRGDGNVLRTGTFEGSYELPDTGFSVRIGGYVKLDAIMDVGDAGSEDLFVTSTIPVDGGGGLSTRLHARQSRLNVDARNDTEAGLLRVFLEGDFFGGGGTQTVSNAHSFRLRHAFGSLDRLLAGQTWSSFMDVDTLPETLDFEGPPGQSFIRQPQIRWTQPVTEALTVTAAVENPEGDVLDDGASVNADRLPDAIVRGRWSRPWGHLQSAALLRDIAVEDASGVDDSAFGWGVNLSGQIRTPSLGAYDNAIFQFNYGDGIGRYILDLAGSGADAVIDPATGKLETLEALGGYLGYQHWWQDDLRSTFVAGYASLDTESFQPATTFDNSEYVSGNLVWTPIPQVNLGAETLYGRRENRNGADGEAWRFQLSAQFLF